MKILFKITYQSFMYRKLISVLTILTLSFSLTLLSFVNRVVDGVQSYFTASISSIDLIVGPKGGNLDLLFSTVFQIGSPPYVMNYEAFEKFKNHPSVKAAIPLSFGDSFEGFRVIGTTQDFFNEIMINQLPIELDQGQFFQGEFDVVIGQAIAEKLKLTINQEIKISHGIGQNYGISQHEDKFKISGILKKTYGHYDKIVFVNLKSMVHLHEKEESENAHAESDHHDHESHHPETINAFFLKGKNRIFTLFLQRQILDDQTANLNAIIPAVEITNFWNNLDFIIIALKGISYFVIILGFFSMLIMLLTRLNDRRREISIYRSLGASPLKIFLLLEFESLFLTTIGIFISYMLSIILLTIAKGFIFDYFGISFTAQLFTLEDFNYAAVLLLFSLIAGAIPGLIAYKQSLKEGLLIKL